MRAAAISSHAFLTSTGPKSKMPVYRPTPSSALRHTAIMRAYGAPGIPTATPPTPLVANTPAAASLTQAPGGALNVTWTAPATDATHNAATGFNLQSSPSGANTWTTVSGVTSPYLLSGQPAGSEIDVQIQSANAAGTSA